MVLWYQMSIGSMKKGVPPWGYDLRPQRFATSEKHVSKQWTPEMEWGPSQDQATSGLEILEFCPNPQYNDPYPISYHIISYSYDFIISIHHHRPSSTIIHFIYNLHNSVVTTIIQHQAPCPPAIAPSILRSQCTLAARRIVCRAEAILFSSSFRSTCSR